MEVVGKTYLVLIVEDNEFVAEGIRLDLEHDGHRTLTACNVEEGLSLVEAERPDIVLCDLSLRDGRNGYALAEALNDRRPAEKPLLIAHSGYGDSYHRKRARESGFDLFMKKPLDIDAFNRRIGRFLESGIDEEDDLQDGQTDLPDNSPPG